MSLLTKAGITKLSELTIDADKDWAAMGITNLAAVMAGATQGDMIWRGLNILQRIPGGGATYVLTSAGPHAMPTWQPGGGALDKYIGCTIELAHAEAVVTPDKTHSENAPVTSGEDELQPPMATSVGNADAEAVVTPDKSDNENCPFASTPDTVVA